MSEFPTVPALFLFFAFFAMGAKIFAAMSPPPGIWALLPLVLVSAGAAIIIARRLFP